MRILEEHIKICQECPLHKKIPEGCTPVAGIGNINAKVMIVVDCVRSEQVILDEPLGLKESNFLKSVININQVYITPLVKCNPKNDKNKERPANKSEINACSLWLGSEIGKIKPKVIIGMGQKTHQHFLDNVDLLDKNLLQPYNTAVGEFIPSHSIHRLLNGSQKDVDDFKRMIRKVVNCE